MKDCWSSVGGNKGEWEIDDDGFKVKNWKKKMDEYYESVSREKLIEDLNAAGIEVKKKENKK